MRINDLVVLGRTVPEESQRYGVRVCLAGHSRALNSLVRVYPVLIDAPFTSRHQVAIEVARNPHDSRHESYRLQDAVAAIHHVSPHPVLSTAHVAAMAEREQAPSIQALNAARRSLGFVAVCGTPTLVWKTRKDVHSPLQLALFDTFLHDLALTKFLTGKDYARVPYLQFRDRDGLHCLQVREWGCFEYLRKQDGADEELATRLRLDDPTREWFLLLGNMTSHRTVWLVIQLFSRPKMTQTLFEGLTHAPHPPHP